MNTGNRTATTVDFRKARLVSTFKEIDNNLLSNDDIASRLTRRLQTSLDIRQLVNIFVEEVGNMIPFDQFEFHSNIAGHYLTSQKRAVHSCEYHLKLEETDIGEVLFSRSVKFIEEELTIIERLIGTLVYPLRNAIQYKEALEAALQDSLTGCGNKRALDIHLHREAELARRHNQALSIVMLDVDHFKKINDTWGHSAGDTVLKQLADCIASCARKSDMCFRYGGEEFILILNRTTPGGARIISERLRKAIENARFFHGDQEIPVTVSAGTSTLNNNETLRQLTERADKALYRAKGKGRNQVVSAEAKERKITPEENNKIA
jgi:diguanylate cyclase (GGDEF)-like protein